jgi:diadenosine tetraphosphate (Ap4A) HIT family hydrolase
MGTWTKPQDWQKMCSGEACPFCISIHEDGHPWHTITQLEATYLCLPPWQHVRGYCYLILKRHAIELHDLGEAEAAALMRDLQNVSRALTKVTNPVKMNIEIHGNTIPHLHVRFFPRYVGDPFEHGPIDQRKSILPNLEETERQDFAQRLLSALSESLPERSVP